MTNKTGKVKGQRGVAIVILIFFTLITCSLIFYQNREKLRLQEGKLINNSLKHYQNLEIGISFDYPSDWGEVSFGKENKDSFLGPGGYIDELTGDFEIYDFRIEKQSPKYSPDHLIFYGKDVKNIKNLSIKNQTLAAAAKTGDENLVFKLLAKDDRSGPGGLWTLKVRILKNDSQVQRVAIYRLTGSFSAVGPYGLDLIIEDFYFQGKKMVQTSLPLNLPQEMGKRDCMGSSSEKCFKDFVEYANGPVSSEVQREINILTKVLDSVKLD